MLRFCYTHAHTHTHVHIPSPCLFSSGGGRSSALDDPPIALGTQCSKPSGRGATPKVHLPVHAVSSSPDAQQSGRLSECTSIQS